MLGDIKCSRLLVVCVGVCVMARQAQAERVVQWDPKSCDISHPGDYPTSGDRFETLNLKEAYKIKSRLWLTYFGDLEGSESPCGLKPETLYRVTYSSDKVVITHSNGQGGRSTLKNCNIENLKLESDAKGIFTCNEHTEIEVVRLTGKWLYKLQQEQKRATNSTLSTSPMLIILLSVVVLAGVIMLAGVGVCVKNKIKKRNERRLNRRSQEDI